MQYIWRQKTAIGNVTMTENGRAITAVFFGGAARPGDRFRAEPTELLTEAFAQLNEYLAGTRTEFTLPLAPEGTEFQRRVWAALEQIPYGETRSYGQLAEEMGCPGAARALGQALHRNPILIFLPCHRVIGADGSPGGYAGGPEIKEKLLNLEKFRKELAF